MKHIRQLPSLETLNKFLSYDPATGELIWKKAEKFAAQRQEGRAAGTMSKGGYLRTTIHRVMYANSRIAWKLYYGNDPEGVIDHIDGNKLNNAITNLRDITQSQNLYNSVTHSNSTTGVKGVVYDPNTGTYRVNLKAGDERLRPGRGFDTIEEADKYLRQVREILHGEYACHGERQ